MLNRARHHLAALIALALAAVAALFVGWFPCMGHSQTATVRSPGEGGVAQTSTRCVSLVEANGPGVRRVLAIPVVLAAAGAAAASLHLRVALVVIGVLSLAFCLLAILSVGIFFLPSAAALLAAAAIAPGRERA
ncbi:MAG: hypothetical protein ACRDJ4_16470 [Actinomycetota bacterium]